MMTEQNDHYIRLVTFTVEGCPQPLWGLFEMKAKLDQRPGIPFTDLNSYFAFHQPLLQHMLNRGYINHKQFGLVCSANPVDITKWDITLASTMLQNFFKPLPANEHSFINDIRQVRNSLQHTAGRAELDEPTFRQYWTTLRQSTLDLASLVSTDCYDATKEYIDELQYKALPAPGGVLEILREWYLVDKELEADVKRTLDAAKESNAILNATVVRSKTQSGIVSKRLKTTDLVLENMKAAMTNTFNRIDLANFEPPSEISSIRSELRDKHRVIVAGYGNSKQLETCLYAIKDMGYTLKRCVQITLAKEFSRVCCDDVDLILCIDPFGKDTYDSMKAKAVSDHLDQILQNTKLGQDEGRIDFVLSTSQTVLDSFKAENDHELLENVISINKPTTEMDPININAEKHRVSDGTKGHALLTLLEHSSIYISDLKQYNATHHMFETAKRMLRQHKAIVLLGLKTSRSDILAANLTSSYCHDQCLVLNNPSDWTWVKISEVSVVIISDFTGKYKYDKRKALKWFDNFDVILAAVKARKLNVIITSCRPFLSRCIREISRHDLLVNTLDLTPMNENNVVVKKEPGTSNEKDSDEGQIRLAEKGNKFELSKLVYAKVPFESILERLGIDITQKKPAMLGRHDRKAEQPEKRFFPPLSPSKLPGGEHSVQDHQNDATLPKEDNQAFTISWIGATYDVFFIATQATKTLRKQLQRHEFKRAARNPWRTLAVKPQLGEDVVVL